MNLLKWDIFKKFTATHGRLIKSYDCVKFSSVDQLRSISNEINFPAIILSFTAYIFAIMGNRGQEYDVIEVISFFVSFAFILINIQYYLEYYNSTNFSQKETIINVGLICLYTNIIMFIKMTIAISTIGLIFIYWIGLKSYFILSVVTPPICCLCAILTYIITTLLYVTIINIIKVFNLIR